MLEIVEGNLLSFPCDIIVQQCNCITRQSLGLASEIAKQLGVNPYSKRKGPSKNVADSGTSSQPGTIHIEKAKEKDIFVASLFAQYAPGSCSKKYPIYEKILQEREIKETFTIRQNWFLQCLEKLAEETKLLGLKTIAFPYGIGCGLAGGSWPQYHSIIEEWANQHPEFDVKIVQLAQ